MSTIDEKGTIQLCTGPNKMQISSLHYDEFLLINTHKHLIFLGIPWHNLHDPQISWNQHEIIKWSEHCQSNCLQGP